MKCVQHPTTKEVKRVTEAEAKRLVKQGWSYVPKLLWKRGKS